MIDALSPVARTRLLASEMFVNACSVSRRVRDRAAPASPTALGAVAFETRISEAWGALSPELALADDADRPLMPATVRRIALLVHDLHIYLGANLAAAGLGDPGGAAASAVEEAWSEYVELHDTLLSTAEAAQASRPHPGHPHLRLVDARAVS